MNTLWDLNTPETCEVIWEEVDEDCPPIISAGQCGRPPSIRVRIDEKQAWLCWECYHFCHDDGQEIKILEIIQ